MCVVNACNVPSRVRATVMSAARGSWEPPARCCSGVTGSGTVSLNTNPPRASAAMPYWPPS